MAEDDSSTLVVLLETHEQLWQSLQDAPDGPGYHKLSPVNFVKQVLAFLRAFLVVNLSNKVAIFAVHESSSPLLFLSPSMQQSEAKKGTSQGSQANSDSDIAKRIDLLIHRPGQGQEGPALAGAISRALCFMHRQHLGRSQPGGQQGLGARVHQQQRKARILCLHASPDVPAQYIAMMNAVFSAQRSDVVIDACMVGRVHSSLLQQAAYLTGGIYTKPARPGLLLEYLLTIYSGDTHSRSFLKLPQLQGVDFRASCFCHKKAIDLGYVCSVCLSIFCESLQECSTCGTVFSAAEVGEKRRCQSIAGPSRRP